MFPMQRASEQRKCTVRMVTPHRLQIPLLAAFSSYPTKSQLLVACELFVLKFFGILHIPLIFQVLF